MPCQRDVGRYLKKIGNSMEQHANQQLQSLDLTFSQSKLLMVLGDREHYTASMKELEGVFHSAQSTVSGLVSRMEKKGLVQCSSPSGDKRVKQVTLTEAGLALRAQGIRDIETTNEWLVSALNAEERVLLLDMLDRIYCTVTQTSEPVT